REAREQVAARLDALLAGGAVLMLPTVPDIAPVRGAPDTATVAFRERAFRMLCIAGLARLPQLSLPLAQHDGCPLGLSLIAAHGEDERLLAIATALDAA
ncbi:MAG: amidase, partial [Gemmatimonadetes bacterium]|nr:amidase [Gemmatimonadota bacterium]